MIREMYDIGNFRCSIETPEEGPARQKKEIMIFAKSKSITIVADCVESDQSMYNALNLLA